MKETKCYCCTPECTYDGCDCQERPTWRELMDKGDPDTLAEHKEALRRFNERTK